MRTNTTIALACLLITGSLSACSEKETSNEAPKAEKLAAAKEAEEAATKVVEGPWVGYDKAAIRKKFEGSWVVAGSGSGTKVAWNIKGDVITISSGADDKAYKLEIESPCSLRVIEESENGSSSTTSKFTWQGDVLFKGLGNSGSSNPDGSIVACISGDTYTLAGGTCTKWKQDHFGGRKWKESPAECALVEGDPSVFEVGSSKLNMGEEGALMNSQMSRNKAESFPDFEAAKAALIAK
ncbi:MAG: hypothetical protein GY811_02640 [Myxococcales bacterium]|nr:hypothetical protein [Myxococcales bacterium]